MVVRREEIFQSLSIIRQVLRRCPPAPSARKWAKCRPDRVALGYVEGWRGEIFHWIHTAPGNRLARCKVKDPSLQNWPALSEAIMGNIIAGFSGGEQKLQPLLFRNGPLTMFEALRQSLKTGVVTTNYPDTPPEVSTRARGKPEIDWAELEGCAPRCRGLSDRAQFRIEDVERPARRPARPGQVHLLRPVRRGGLRHPHDEPVRMRRAVFATTW